MFQLILVKNDFRLLKLSIFSLLFFNFVENIKRFFGMPAHVLQKLLGHTDVSITINTYTSIFDKYKKEEFDKFLEYKRLNNI